jgi:hypothetical protein
MLLYSLLCRCLLRQPTNLQAAALDNHKTTTSSLQRTYQLIASTLGFLAGLCSQFFLSFCLWKNQMTEPLLDNVILFSLLWSMATVGVTFCGCLSLRLLTSMDHPSATSKERTFLHMESYYVFFSLIGICLAWILMDVVLDMKDQIFPSLVMLALSLACFGVILRCFPEGGQESSAASLEDELVDDNIAVQPVVSLV